MSITYREATAADAHLLGLLRWEADTERHPEHNGNRDAYLANFVAETRPELERGMHRAWIAEAEGQPVACVLLIWWVMPPSVGTPHRRRGYVSSVYTQPAYRQQGIARRLMDTLIEEARRGGITRLHLRASKMGRSLYESQGFVPSIGMDLEL